MGFSVSSKIKLNMPVVKQLDRAKQQALEQTGNALPYTGEKHAGNAV